jgi:hypothetical protein
MRAWSESAGASRRQGFQRHLRPQPYHEHWILLSARGRDVQDRCILTLLHSATMYLSPPFCLSMGGNGEPVANSARPSVHSNTSLGLYVQCLVLGVR